MRNAIMDRACSKFLAVAIALTLVPGPTSAAVSDPELPDPGHTGMSREQQIQLGLKSAAEVYKGMPVLPDNSPETQYVRQLGAKLVSTIPQQYTWPYEFHVVLQKEINAFALPGGPMFINIGTITAADNEAELAGVMAHEMSHVYMQHSARQVAKAKKTGIFAGIAGAVAGATLGGVGGELAQEGIQFGAQGLMLKYSRGDEAQADAVGAIILWKAGYNPQALADFFKKPEQQGGGAGPQFLSDHPNPGNCEAVIQNEIANCASRAVPGQRFGRELLRHTARAVAGTERKAVSCTRNSPKRNRSCVVAQRLPVIGENTLGPAVQGRLSVDDPLGLAVLIKPRLKFSGVSERSQLPA